MQARNSGRALVSRQLRVFPSAPTGILRAMKFMASIERDAATERRGYTVFAIHHLDPLLSLPSPSAFTV